MIRKRYAIVTEIIYCDEYITEILVDVEDNVNRAINYNKLTGLIKVGDKVSLNTNAISLKLGTGGFHFVIENLGVLSSDFSSPEGHIIKLRYTPMQIRCLSAEEQESGYRNIFENQNLIYDLPVIIGELHSMLYPAVHLLKHLARDIKIVYIMTDSACLPIWHSNVVRQLYKEGMLIGSITYGQAFGGDCEVVNLYTALIAAKHIFKCDLAIIIPGPGVVGTDTTYGFSGIEQANIIDAVNNLKGLPIIIPRISFADKRSRHLGISHHTLTILGKLTYSSVYMGIPKFNDERKNILIQSQILNNGIDKRHKIDYNIRYCEEELLSILYASKFDIDTMGRNLNEDKEFFITIDTAVKLCFEKIM